ncbi:hypothetical protein BLOT_005144 [Blomia tropicalis]|nr:hypothetical protein BLOT_005144 [Blomia tropicalis]
MTIFHDQVHCPKRMFELIDNGSTFLIVATIFTQLTPNGVRKVTDSDDFIRRQKEVIESNIFQVLLDEVV